MSWLSDRIEWLHAPWTRTSDIQRDIAAIRVAVLEIPTIRRHLENLMAADRDLITTILAALPAIADGIAAKDAKIAEQAQQLADAGAAAAADEAEDTAALAPVKEAVDAMVTALSASSSTPDEQPAPIPVEDVPAAVDEAAQAEAVDPGPVPDASTDA